MALVMIDNQPTQVAGPPSRIFRVVYTSSQIGYRVETFNRVAAKWQLWGYERGLNIARTLERVGVGVFLS